jgi:hypothetical protein
MKTLLAILLATLCAATGYAQTMKALAYNTTNGVVVYGGSNTLTFTTSANFEADIFASSFETGSGTNFTQVTPDGLQFGHAGIAAATRTNLGLPLAALTNANVTNFRTAISAARAPVWAYKATNQTNATTNLVSDSALTFTAAANTKYAVELFLVAKSSVAALQGKINSTNATSFGFWVQYDAASQFAWLAGNRVTNRANLVSFDGNDVSVWQRFVIVAPTNNATVAFQFAPADTNGSAVIEAGSYLKAEVIE